jgi:integrase
VGSIYRPKYRAADGTLKESRVLWLKYRAGGRVVRQSSGTETEREARKLLALREGAAAEGKVILPRADKVTVRELADDLTAEYAANGRRSAERLAGSLSHLLPVLGDRRAVQLTSADVTRYTQQRQQEGAANATVNRELAALKRAFSLAVTGEKLPRAPHIAMLLEDNVRKGFFEREPFEAVRRHLPAYAQPAVTFAYITGWRLQAEILTLQWRQVDFEAGTVRLEPGTTKNRDGRTFVMVPELRACLEAQRAATDALQREAGAIIPWVFHHAGRPIKGFRRAWNTACRRAGVSGRIPHDFRRTAVRNLERAGVPRSTAMAMVGHKTEAIYRRYSIVDSVMLQEGAAKLAAFSESQANLGKDLGKVASIRSLQ